MSTANGSPRRYVRGLVCPVCGGSETDKRGQGSRCFGFLSPDGQWAHCTREENGDGCRFHPDSETYAHKIGGRCNCGVEHAPPPPGSGRSKGGKLGRIVATYDYLNADGDKLVMQVTRHEPKTFRQRRPDGKGGWIPNLQGITPVLYRLPELLAADPAEAAFLVEGEKDADRLRSFGLVATSSPMGAEAPGRKRWREGCFASDLAGRRVVIVPDHDKPGREFSALVAGKLHGVASEVRVIDLAVDMPDLPEHGDVSDWLNRGRSIADLKRLADEAPVWTPPAESNGKHQAIANGKPPAEVGRGNERNDRPRGFNLTDLGNAERLVDLHGRDLRYCHPWSKWIVWDGRRWAIDKTAAARRRARETVRHIYAEAAAEEDDEHRKALVKHAIASEDRKRIGAMLALAEAEAGIPILPEQMDLDPWLFNCRNGTIDLQTGELRPHRRSDLITKLCPLDYDPTAECPLWLSTLDLFFAGNADLIGYWQRLCGYCLVGVIRDHIMPVAYGTGNNGKSTILGTLLNVFGTDYAMKAMPDLLMAKKQDTHPTDKADLFGMRLVVAIETEAGRRLNESQIKELSGNDRIRARRMREDPWEFQPTHTLVMATNHKPVVRGTDNGIWRRLKLVPFNVKVEGREDDKAMPEKLRAEYSGILTWCVRGCLDWQNQGLEPPDVVEEATQGYRLEQDILGQFLEEHTIKNPLAKVKSSQIYERYKEWAKDGNEFVMTHKAFGLALVERGFPKKESHGMWYQGIGLRALSGSEGDPAREEGAF